MNRTCEFVDCKAIKKALENSLPNRVNVLRVWEGAMRNDNAIKVYVVIRQSDGIGCRHFTEITLRNMKEVIGELLDVEIIGMNTIEFGFALPLTSHYYLHK